MLAGWERQKHPAQRLSAACLACLAGSPLSFIRQQNRVAGGVTRLLSAAMAEDLELGLFVRLAVVLGARRGELVGLKWRDVDLDAGAVLIASSVVRVAGRPHGPVTRERDATVAGSTLAFIGGSSTVNPRCG
jgi:hypothetical protein